MNPGTFILKIKRQENRFYSFLYKLAKAFYRFNIPTIKPVHLPLYYLDSFIKFIFKRIFHTFWSIPLFKARCQKVGKNLQIPNGIPLVIGSHLKIILGDNVTIQRSTIGASKVFDEPVFIIGNNTSINYGTTISVSKEIIIGNDCMISGGCMIMDSDDHPVDPVTRAKKLPVDPSDVKPVKIGNNVWIGANSTILKGVTIGDNSIVATHSVVTKNIPTNCIFGNEPAKLIKKDIHKTDDSR